MATPLVDWFSRRDWTPFPFQRETWQAYGHGASGLLHAPTGMGKTWAVWGGPLCEWLAEAPDGTRAEAGPPPLRVLWITPLRALAGDTARALEEPLAELGIPWTVERRTGDTPSSVKQRQRKRLPSTLITTPESLSILLSYAGAERRFRGLRCVIVDEWHELLGSKRGVQTELCLARLRRLAPGLRTWGLSATLGNLDEALETLVGPRAAPGRARLVRGRGPKDVRVETLAPSSLERFPWSGHLGLRMMPQVIEALERGGSTLLFTNTRSQAEIWHRALVMERPDWLEQIALHHGSLDRDLRCRVEARLAAGDLRCVVCTSSLDLGVDFSPVDRVIQVGSPKGVARTMQRAGRSGHQPGAVSRVIGLPTNAFELVEFAAARDSIDHGVIESRPPVDRPLDVLAQHLVTVAMGDGFDADAMLAEVRTTRAYARLRDDEWQWALDFVTRGGPTLRAYPEYSKVVAKNGRHVVESRQIAQRHRMSIGTITSDEAMQVRWSGGRGGSLGTVEESFISRLRPGDCFAFAGRIVELKRVRDMRAYVAPARRTRGAVPRWSGGRSPLSTQLADAVRRKLEEARLGVFDGPEMEIIRPLLELQARWSRIPASDELLIETARHRGHHLFVFSFAGRLVNEGLSALVGHRLSQTLPCSVRMTGNDYGFELLCSEDPELDEAGWRRLLSTERLLDDLLAALNASELAKRHFRGIARVAGLVFPGYPGQGKTTRQLQASSGLFYDVFSEFDPGHPLLEQARREALDREMEVTRLRRTLHRMAGERMTIVPVKRFTPLAFPLWAEQMRATQVSSESWLDRVQRMAAQLERAAGAKERAVAAG